MKLAMNLLWLIPDVVGGSEEYTVGLLEAFADHGPKDLELELFAQPRLTQKHPQLDEAFSVRSLPAGVSMKPLRFAAECSWLAGATRNHRLVHHGGGVLPYGGVGPSVVTIHDLQPLELPANFSRGQQRWFQVMLPRVARRADRIICPSRYTADRMIELLDVQPAAISVVPPVHQLSKVVVSVRSPAPVPSGDPYLLYPAVSHPHKRHVDAVEALHLLAEKAPDLHLVMTGAAGAAAESLTDRIGALGLADRVHVLGRVDPGDLEALMRGAAALVFPSVYEGFGNPVLEAMARSVPVVAASATALPEVAGGAAVLVAPENPPSLADGIWSVLHDEALAHQLRRRGLQRAADFSSESACEALVRAYRGALA